MPRNEDKYCMRFEFDLRGCGSRTESQEPQDQPTSSRHGRREGRERTHRGHSRHPSDLRTRSPPIATRVGTLPPPVERHRSRHRSHSQTRAHSPNIQVRYSRPEEVPVSHPRRSSSVRRRDTSQTHPEEVTVSYQKRSRSRHRRDNSISQGRHDPPLYDDQFQNWVPGVRQEPVYYAEPISAPPQPTWAPERHYNPAPAPGWVPANVQMPPPPPPHRRYTTDATRPAESPYVDCAAGTGAEGTHRDPLHRTRRFYTFTTDAERVAPRESRQRDYDRPVTGSRVPNDAHRRREHAHDCGPEPSAPQEMHYDIHVEYRYTTAGGSSSGVYHNYDLPHPPTSSSYHQSHEHPHPYSSGTAYDNEPPSSRQYTGGTGYHRSTQPPRPSTPHRDYENRPSGGGRGGREFPAGPSGGAGERIQVKDLSEHWAVLGLREGAGDAAIRSAYKRLALECHPDKLIKLGEREKEIKQGEFLRLKEAHDVLLNI